MNDKLQQFARQSIKDGLAKLPEKAHQVFKKMYGGKQSVAECIALDINEVVDSMPENSLDWAMRQVQRSLDKIAEENESGA